MLRLLYMGLLCMASACVAKAELLPVETFFCQSSLVQVSLSPDANRIAYTVENAEGNLTLKIDTLDADGKVSATQQLVSNVGMHTWLGKDSLFWCTKPTASAPATYWVCQLGEQEPRQLLPDETGHVELIGFTQSDSPSIMFGVSKEPSMFPDIYEYNLADNSFKLIKKNDSQIFSWSFGASPHPVAGLHWDSQGRKRIIAFSKTGAQRTLEEVDREDTLLLLGCNSAGDKVWGLSNKDSDTLQACEWDVTSGERRIIAGEEQVQADVSQVYFGGSTQTAQILSYASIPSKHIAFTPPAAAMLRKCDAQFGAGNYRIQQFDAERSVALILSVSDKNPGAYFVYRGATQALTKWADSVPDFPTEQMCDTQTISYPARDGESIPALLTLPKGKPPFPLIVFPHGGPRMQTIWGFDGRVQFLASRGFAVLQPNFRGSRGFGKAWMNAGNLQWGTGVMQHDLSDGVTHLVKTGVARKESVVIFGGSYGGYAALAGLCFTPELYAAGICLFGSSDLSKQHAGNPVHWEAFKGEYDSYIADESTKEGHARCHAQSPVHHTMHILAPLFLYHGHKDDLIPFSHSTRMIENMDKNKKQYVFYSSPDEAHGFSSPIAEATVYAEIEKFLHHLFRTPCQQTPSPSIQKKVNTLQLKINKMEE